jgi:hypothetical protein
MCSQFSCVRVKNIKMIGLLVCAAHTAPVPEETDVARHPVVLLWADAHLTQTDRR